MRREMIMPLNPKDEEEWNSNNSWSEGLCYSQTTSIEIWLQVSLFSKDQDYSRNRHVSLHKTKTTRRSQRELENRFDASEERRSPVDQYFLLLFLFFLIIVVPVLFIYSWISESCCSTNVIILSVCLDSGKKPYFSSLNSFKCFLSKKIKYTRQTIGSASISGIFFTFIPFLIKKKWERIERQEKNIRSTVKTSTRRKDWKHQENHECSGSLSINIHYYLLPTFILSSKKVFSTSGSNHQKG